MIKHLRLSDLRYFNEKSIRMAGPKFTPGIDDEAPNLQIADLVEVFDSLSMSDQSVMKLKGLADAIKESHENCKYLRTFGKMGWFHNRLRRLLTELEILYTSSPQGPHSEASKKVLSTTKVQISITSAYLDEIYGLKNGDDYKSRDQNFKERLQREEENLKSLMDSLESLHEYLERGAGQFLGRPASLLLVGDWGTGKTHLLCDVANRMDHSRLPALLILADSMAEGEYPFDAVAARTRFASDGNLLLKKLNSLGKASGTRTLLMIDAINEANPSEWKMHLPRMLKELKKFPNVALVLTCRRPVDRLVLPKTSYDLIRMQHFGFEEQEYDAQLAFFTYYDIEIAQTPLLSPEFSRPLFLKLLCLAIKDLKKRSQRQKLREITQGQKSMTYIFESFAKAIGKRIENDFGLPRRSCWRLLKGDDGDADFKGFAGVMADREKDWLDKEEVIETIEGIFPSDSVNAEQLLDRFLFDGMLVEEFNYEANELWSRYKFSYQRFSDHLIARHLLERYLDVTDENSIRRSLYLNKKIGRIFAVSRRSNYFESPGIASAIMLEFPERIRNLSNPTELVFYLPKNRRPFYPVANAFLDGLFWRHSKTFTTETERLICLILSASNSNLTEETYETLYAIASRAGHYCDARWLSDNLKKIPMNSRDQTWSEYIRYSEPTSAIYRLISWVERCLLESRKNAFISDHVILLMLILTSTDNALRDRATKALFEIGMRYPNLLFDQVERSFEFDDPYISERTIAAAYGVAMNLWSNPSSSVVRSQIVKLGRALVSAMFMPTGLHATKHSLMRGYAAGIVEITLLIDTEALTSYEKECFAKAYEPSFGNVFTDISDTAVGAKDALSAMHMDFANYTIGRLIEDRGNYDMDNAEYISVRNQIANRMMMLGYRSAIFEKIDRSISRLSNYEHRSGKLERYGKKYSRIAFYEMLGLREDLGKFSFERADERTSDCDIDPSFPDEPVLLEPVNFDYFRYSRKRGANWLRGGLTPSYQEFLVRECAFNARNDSWTLVSAKIESGGSHDRVIRTEIFGLLIQADHVESFVELASQSTSQMFKMSPRAATSYYTYAGEIPWSGKFTGNTQTRVESVFTERDLIGSRPGESSESNLGAIELPFVNWVWESYHSELNPVGNAVVPSSLVCQELDLVRFGRTFDLYTTNFEPATIYRELPNEVGHFPNWFLYVRSDLLSKYLGNHNLELVWAIDGERTIRHESIETLERDELSKIYQLHSNEFASVQRWTR